MIAGDRKKMIKMIAANRKKIIKMTQGERLFDVILIIFCFLTGLSNLF